MLSNPIYWRISTRACLSQLIDALANLSVVS